MNYEPLSDDAEEFYICSHPFGYMQYKQPEPVAEPIARKPNEAFYVHLQDAPKDYYPAFILNFRRKFSVKSMEQSQQRAAELKQQMLKERVDRLALRSANVAKLIAAADARKGSDGLALLNHTVKDMQDHLQRYERSRARRVDQLRCHNELVKRRSDLLRFGLYLTSIAKQYEENRKRIGIF